MTTALQLRRGTTAQHSTFTGAVGEVTVDTDKDTLVVHDGATVGGHPLAKAADLNKYVRFDTASQGLTSGQQSNARTNIGLGNVNNTSDANKPISTATQAALDQKLDKAGGTLTGALTLYGNAVNPLEAVPKQQMDSAISTAIAGVQPPQIPAGLVVWFAANTPPTGYLKANGATISRSTYSALFAAIGTTFGAGDGSTTFRIPDLRGEFIRGWDDGRGVDTSRAFGSAQAHQMQSHTHTWGRVSSESGGNVGSSTWSGSSSLPTNTSAAGGTSNSSENRPRNVALLACIKF